MFQGSRRYRLAREEIGILLSFAKNPDAVTEDWVRRLQIGVREDELMEFVVLAGLPSNMVERLVEIDSMDEAGAGTNPLYRRTGYRRAIIGVLAVYVLFAVVINFASESDMLRSFSLAAGFIVAAIVIYRVIARISSSMG